MGGRVGGANSKGCSYLKLGANSSIYGGLLASCSNKIAKIQLWLCMVTAEKNVNKEQRNFSDLTVALY